MNTQSYVITYSEINTIEIYPLLCKVQYVKLFLVTTLLIECSNMFWKEIEEDTNINTKN